MKQLAIQQYISKLSSEAFNELLSNVRMIPLLTIEEEIELIHQIRKGGSEAEQAKEFLAKSYLRFIYSVAKTNNHQSFSLQQLMVCGITGLIKAAEKYDETHGFIFTSYAIWWIRQSILNYIAKHNAQPNGCAASLD